MSQTRRFQVRQRIERDEVVALGVERELGDGRVAQAQIELDKALRRAGQHLGHGRGDRAAAGDDQHLAAHADGPHAVERIGHAGCERGMRGHARGGGFTGHPGQQALAQQPEVLLDRLGIARRRQWPGVDGAHHRLAVVLVQARQRGGRQVLAIALDQSRQRLRMPAQRADEHRVEALPPRLPVGAEVAALRMAGGAELVVVGRAKAGLAVADKVEASHAAHDARPARRRLSRQ
mmetsp:Transcript_10016/g.40723  ORF Transcript_10016/g.40723 Transcript_10016/m.40723 type:complete len:234 (-) Transcript_10016:989-1690(-)